MAVNQSSSTDMSLSAYLRSRTALAPKLHQASCYQLPASKVPAPTHHHGDPFLVVLTQMLLSLVLSFHLSHTSVNTMRRNLPFPTPRSTESQLSSGRTRPIGRSCQATSHWLTAPRVLPAPGVPLPLPIPELSSASFLRPFVLEKKKKVESS